MSGGHPDAEFLDAFPHRDLLFHRAGRSGCRWRHLGGDRLKAEQPGIFVAIQIGEL
jgi:hypothetical protein